eukprot:TRINITY_DN93278_c0_g1_i1.p1 TRINITY_DN93278_c0_g1~~TRINITY_DN93278_c0_g1_i1.p1  ORF type:complete len:530 (+),score=53.62 TRINITY_DN93278_c0_g1_i1:102-1691(+)
MASLRPRNAVLYYYNTAHADKMELLRTEAREVAIDERPFAQGGCREAFRIRFLRPDGLWGPIEVAKKYKFEFGFRDEFVRAQVGNRMAQRFNKAAQCQLRFALLDRVLELDGRLYAIEEYLQGDWCKYNNIFGDVEYPYHDDPQCALACAFSHFSLVNSGYHFMLLDIQGVPPVYTDPAVVSQQQGQYGYTDTGLKAIQDFGRKHTCNAWCRRLGLQPLDATCIPAPQGENPAGTYVSDTACAILGIPASIAAREHVWEWREPDGSWQKYDKDMQAALDAAVSKGHEQIRIDIAGVAHHVVDLKFKQQLNLQTGERLFVQCVPVRPAENRGKRATTSSPEPVGEHALQMLMDGEWHTYDQVVLQACMDALQSGQRSVILDMNGRRYNFDFESLIQRNLDTGNERPIRFVTYTTAKDEGPAHPAPPKPQPQAQTTPASHRTTPKPQAAPASQTNTTTTTHGGPSQPQPQWRRQPHSPVPEGVPDSGITEPDRPKRPPATIPANAPGAVQGRGPATTRIPSTVDRHRASKS